MGCSPTATGPRRGSSAQPASFHPEVTVGDESTRVLCEMVGAVDARSLGEQARQLTLDQRRTIDAGPPLLSVQVAGWARQDSNLGPTDYESAALTAELRAPPGADYGRAVMSAPSTWTVEPLT